MIYIYACLVMPLSTSTRVATRKGSSMHKVTRQTSHGPVRRLWRALGLLLLISSAAGSTRPQDAAGRVIVKPPEPQLVVNVGARGVITLDGRAEGSLRDTAPLAAALKAVFERRARSAGPDGEFDRAVYIKAPGTLLYGEVVKVIDAAKSAGASPIGLVVGDEKENHAALVGLPQRPRGGDHDPAHPAPASDTATVSENSVIVAVTSGGETYLNKNLIGEGELGPALAALMKGLAEGDRVVYVRPDEAASYGRVVGVVNSAVSAGATAVGFVGRRKRRE